ncbi:MAG: transketolase [Candidatus Bipolaricaulia bacterium]
MVTVKDIDQKSIDTIRTLSMDAVQKASSGHPGTPMALAPVAYLLYTRYLKHNPTDPNWPDRDRFILSNGHASMLLYSTLYLSGYGIPFEELERFRQWASMTPGHPEYGDTPGVETTTGPLGQGCGNSVGMAMAEAHLAARFNTDDHPIVDHHTFVLSSDGDMMEGVSHEAAALAGHLKLGKLIWMFDDNRITIGGSTDLAMSEDVRTRFDAYGWHTQDVEDVNDLEALSEAIEAAQAETERPSFIRIRTHIGYGAPNKQDTSDAHGAPLGEDEVRETKRFYGWPEDETFYVPDDVIEHFREAKARGQQLQQAWQETFEAWQAANPDLAEEWSRIHRHELPEGWHRSLPAFDPADGKEATRKASGKVINEIAGTLPELMGGSADLAPSTKTLIDASGEFQAGSYAERNLRFGVREHGMGAAVSGMALHGGVRPYGATFLIFSDYMRPTLRLASMMKQPTIYVWTHDSIALGEDGPTHQPIEHLMSLRAIPGFTLLRPADANETAAAWRVAIERRKGPVGLALTRQGLPILDTSEYPIAQGVRKGAYVLSDASHGSPRLVLIGTGSEVSLALDAQQALENDGIPTRVVSMPSWELFDEQDAAYRREVLPPNGRKLAIEAGSTLGWSKYVGDDGDAIGLERFGASAPSDVAYENLGFNVDNVVTRAKQLVGT